MLSVACLFKRKAPLYRVWSHFIFEKIIQDKDNYQRKQRIVREKGEVRGAETKRKRVNMSKPLVAVTNYMTFKYMYLNIPLKFVVETIYNVENKNVSKLGYCFKKRNNKCISVNI